MKLYENWMSMVDNTTKLKLLKYFSENRESRVTTQQLSDVLNIPESTLSENLNDLAEINFLGSEKEGKFKFYWILNKSIAAEIGESLDMISQAYNKSVSKSHKKQASTK